MKSTRTFNEEIHHLSNSGGQQELNEPVTPDDFFCPISGQMFLDPVKVPLERIKQKNGTSVDKFTTVERKTIERWINEKGKNPFTRKPIKISDLVPDDEMKKRVTEFLESYKSTKFYENIKETQYKLQTQAENAPQATNRRRPAATNPDADDLIAIGQAERESASNNRAGSLRNRSQESLQSSFPRLFSALDNSIAIELTEMESRNNDRANRLRDILQESSQSSLRFLFEPLREQGYRPEGSCFFNENYLIQIQALLRNQENRVIQRTINALQQYGVTAELIRANWQPSEPTEIFSTDESDALIYFVTGQPPEPMFGIEDTIYDPLPAEFHLTPLQTLREITNLNDNAISCLMRLYPQGLRGDHLRTYDHVFIHAYKLAIITLVRTEGLHPQEALERIHVLSEDECWDIWRQGSRPNTSLRI